MTDCASLLPPPVLRAVPAAVFARAPAVACAPAVARAPAQTIRPLFNAAAALAPSPSCLTPVHADALQACILSSCYHMGQRFLDQRPVFQVAIHTIHTAGRDGGRLVGRNASARAPPAAAGPQWARVTPRVCVARPGRGSGSDGSSLPVLGACCERVRGRPPLTHARA